MVLANLLNMIAWNGHFTNMTTSIFPECLHDSAGLQFNHCMINMLCHALSNRKTPELLTVSDMLLHLFH